MKKILDLACNVGLVVAFFAAAAFALRYTGGGTVPGKEDFVGLALFFILAVGGILFAKEAFGEIGDVLADAGITIDLDWWKNTEDE